MYITDILDVYDSLASLFIAYSDKENKKYCFLLSSLEKDEYLVFDYYDGFENNISGKLIKNSNPYLCEVSFSNYIHNWVGTEVSLITKIKLSDEELAEYLPTGQYS